MMVVTEALKGLLKIKGQTTLIRSISLVVAVAASIVWLPTLTVHRVLIAVLNGILAALVAMKDYALGFLFVQKLWRAE